MEGTFYVYILISLKDLKLYTGFTTDLNERLTNHNNGGNRSTQHRRPLKLIYYEVYNNETDARARERFLKSGRGREVIKKQLANTLKKYKI